MRINFKYFLWMPLFVMLGFPIVSKAGTQDGFVKAKSAGKGSILLVDDHRGRDRDRGRWGRWDRDDWRRDRHWNHERWEHRRRDRDRYYVYPYGYGYGYSPAPYYGYGYAPYTYAYPYTYPYYRYPRGNSFIGGFLNLW